MTKNLNKKIFLFLMLIVILIIYIWIRVENSKYIKEPRASFGDTHEFFDVASMPFFSKQFWISLRPPVVPLIYKFVGRDYWTIVTFQLWLSILSWGALGFAASNMMRSLWIKLLTFIIILGFSLSEEIIMWDYLILGDSISLSVIAIFLTSAFLLLVKWDLPRIIFFSIAALLFAFVRDDLVYYFFMSGIILLILAIFIKYRRHLLVVGSIFVVLFIVSNSLSTVSLRWYRPLLNTISLRILPNPVYLSYFEARGMPVTNALMERSGKYLHADNNALVEDPRLKEFRIWVQKNGKSEFIRFLWFFKADTMQNVFNDISSIFSPRVNYYNATGFRPVIESARMDEILFPIRFGFFYFLIANFIAASCSVVAFYERKFTWLLPLLLIILSYPQAILVWNADANDVARHSLYHNVMLRLGVWILIPFVLDLLLERLPSKLSFFSREVSDEWNNAT